MKSSTMSQMALAAMLLAGCTLQGPTLAGPPSGRPFAVDLAGAPEAGAWGSLAFSLELEQAGRGVMALPAETARVALTIKSGRLGAPVVAEVSRDQFAAGKAEMLIDKLPAGEVDVEVTAFDAGNATLASGKAKASVEAGKTHAVNIRLTFRRPTGGLTIAVDAAEAEPEKPVVTIMASGSASAAPSGVPFAGKWKGSATQASGGTWSVELVVPDSLRVGDVTVSAKYPSLQCGGYWQVTGVSVTKYTFLEILTYGIGKCEDRVVTEITRDASSERKIHYYAKGWTTASGLLERVD